MYSQFMMHGQKNIKLPTIVDYNVNIRARVTVCTHILGQTDDGLPGRNMLLD